MKVGDTVRYNRKTWKITRITPGGNFAMLVEPGREHRMKMVPIRNVEKV